MSLHVSRHAIEQFRQRAILCCERDRTDDRLALCLRQLATDLPRQDKGWQSIAHGMGYQLVIQGGVVVTVLGPLMQPFRRRRRKVRRPALEAVE